MLVKVSYIRKTPNKQEWCVYSKKGKSLGCYPSMKLAKERLRQVEYFKHKAERTVRRHQRLTKIAGLLKESNVSNSYTNS